ncbi:MAG: serine O-acetyltransferase [Puniceicoccales bacterium]|jgi:serine O-acetyltransferase|nr:serine O-acetyltransferase [Puniceicoccales bacterium]
MNSGDTDNNARSAADAPASVWAELLRCARDIAATERTLAPLLLEYVLQRHSLADAIATRLGAKLVYHSERGGHLREVFMEAFDADPQISIAIAADLRAVVARDPACDTVLTPFLWFKGFQAITCHRVAHWLWGQNRREFARYLQSLVSEVFAVDIHPAAVFGRGIMLDHATSFVVGETAIVDDDVSFLHDVTLGGTGKDRGDRHPKVRRRVLVGAGAKILGNIEIGEGAQVGAGSVVLDSVPPHCTVTGVPAKVVGEVKSQNPARDMDHYISHPDSFILGAGI